MRQLISFLVLLLLTTLLTATVLAEAPLTFVITQDMQFFSGPGPEYLQSAFHNTPPTPGEEAVVQGRVPGTDGQNWLLVRFTGHWFNQSMPVWYYLPAGSVPGGADVPALDLMADQNALAAESVRVYADPEGLNYDGFLRPDEAGVTVLAVHGDFVYIEAINPYGIPRRGYIAAADLASPPGVSALETAPAQTAQRLSAADVPLTIAPADSSIEVLALADGTLALRYGAIPENAPWAVTLAVITPDGRTACNFIHGTHDGTEESTVEYLLASPLGFRICRYEGDSQTPIREEHFSLAGEPLRTDVRRYSDGAARPIRGTAGFTVSLGHRTAEEQPVPDTLPLRITAASGAAMQLNVPANTYIPCVRECAEMLLVPVCAGEAGTRLLVFSGEAHLLADVPLPADVFDLQAVAAEDSLALMTTDGHGLWQTWMLTEGTLIPGTSLTLPANRDVALLAADTSSRRVLAVGGTQTLLLLADGNELLLAGQISGSLIHAASDGETAALLMMDDGQLRLERWSLQLP